eukprot:2392500-Amphidinium_carterae.1
MFTFFGTRNDRPPFSQKNFFVARERHDSGSPFSLVAQPTRLRPEALPQAAKKQAPLQGATQRVGLASP